MGKESCRWTPFGNLRNPFKSTSSLFSSVFLSSSAPNFSPPENPTVCHISLSGEKLFINFATLWCVKMSPNCLQRVWMCVITLPPPFPVALVPRGWVSCWGMWGDNFHVWTACSFALAQRLGKWPPSRLAVSTVEKKIPHNASSWRPPTLILRDVTVPSHNNEVSGFRKKSNSTARGINGQSATSFTH